MSSARQQVRRGYITKFALDKDCWRTKLVVSLSGSYGWSFRESRDRWPCDNSRSEFHSFLVADTGRKGHVFRLRFFDQHVCSSYSVWTFFPYTRKKKKKFLTTVISAAGSVKRRMYIFYTLGQYVTCFLHQVHCVCHAW